MKILIHSWLMLVVMVATQSVTAQTSPAAQSYDAPTFMDEFDPTDPNAEEILKEYDRYYQDMTGKSPFLSSPFDVFRSPEGFGLFESSGCYQKSCPVFIHIMKSTQTATLYLDGQPTDEGAWPVSTGKGNRTPNMDRHPNGRVYDAYTSNAYPGGDYMGLGNMPYAVFIQGGYAIHGTPRQNWSKLGSKDSHGCIRLHPDNAYYFNQLVRSYGVGQVWVTVDESGELLRY
ncbi:MAG: L,D-transpeptidase [Bdellovibrionales bacterium]